LTPALTPTPASSRKKARQGDRLPAQERLHRQIRLRCPMTMRALLIVLCLSVGSAQSTEITLFGRDGSAVAYIADDLTMYLWSGVPVAYLKTDQTGGGFHIYGFNGQHLGWYVAGVVRDREGQAVGARREALLTLVKLEPLKALKKLQPLKSIEKLAPLRPLFRNTWASVNLDGFLLQGQKTAGPNVNIYPVGPTSDSGVLSTGHVNIYPVAPSAGSGTRSTGNVGIYPVRPVAQSGTSSGSSISSPTRMVNERSKVECRAMPCGAIRFRIVPGSAEILIDGKLIGLASEFVGRNETFTLPPKIYQLVIRAEGYTSFSRMLTIQPNGTVAETRSLIRR